MPHRDVPMILWVISGKNAMQVFLMFFTIASAMPSLLGAPSSASLALLLPSLAVRAWGGCLALGAVTNLVAVYWRSAEHPERPLVLEMISAFFLSSSVLIYPVGLLIFAPSLTSAWFVLVITFGYSVACFARALQCLRDRRNALRLRREVREAGA